MSTTPSIPGVDSDALARTIDRDAFTGPRTARLAAIAAIAYIAAHHECACDREHDDEWVEVDAGDWRDLPNGVRLRNELMKGCGGSLRRFVHRADLPDDPRTLIARELGPAKADTFLGLLDEHGWTVTRKATR